MNGQRTETSTPTEQTSKPTPRWVKGFIVAAAIIAAIVIAAFVQGGNHGPGRHEPVNEPADTAVPVEHQPPVDHDS